MVINGSSVTFCTICCLTMFYRRLQCHPCYVLIIIKVTKPVSTHYHTMPHFDALKIHSCGKHYEKRRNCLEQAISPFLTMFSTLHGTYFSFWMHFKMSSAICFNLDQSKILSSGNGFEIFEMVIKISKQMKAFIGIYCISKSTECLHLHSKMNNQLKQVMIRIKVWMD